MKCLTPIIALLSASAYSIPNSNPASIQSASQANNGVAGDIATRDSGEKLLAKLEKLIPAHPPTSVRDAMSRLKRIHTRSNATGYVEMATELILEGIVGGDLKAMGTELNPLNNPDNVNKREPSTPIYPKASPKDPAYYAQTEAQLRKQIYIPSTFTYGEKPPVLLVPGTGERGGNSFQDNYMKTLAGKDYADIVWLNPPGFQLADAQDSSETVAYAINYISGISKNRKVRCISWSQGTINVQWALKYWTSARERTALHIANSGDGHGTIVANAFSPLHLNPAAPAIFQQAYNSIFTKVLRSNGGDSTYVPTTNIYSGFFDEVVEPQQGTGASAFLKDAHGAGVLNADIGLVCGKDKPAGFALHEGVLYNSLTQALVKDALQHGGVAKLDRIDLKTVCQRLVAEGLTLEDLVKTEKTIPFAVYQIEAYTPKVTKEPKIRKYAM